MSVSLTHNFVSAIPDGVDTTIVRPSNWNDQHVLTMATARLLGRTTAGTGAAEEIGVTAPISLSAGALAMPAATTLVDGYLSHTDWTTFNAKGSGTVTSVAALTLGTTGTDLTSSVATGTTTPVITLNVPTASASNRGALSSADWSTFNGKQSTITFGTGVQTALGVNIGSAGAPVLFNGAGGAPSSLTLTNATGLPIGGGGTGQTTANAALNALLPSQTGNNTKFLTTDGTNSSWGTPSGGGSFVPNGTNTGTNATSGGVGSVANGTNAAAYGASSNATGGNATAVGDFSLATGDNAVAVGASSNATGVWAISIGKGSVANGALAIALGAIANATGGLALAFGEQANANGTAAYAAGSSCVANGDAATAIGSSCNAQGSGATALGATVTAIGGFASAVGALVTANGSNAMAYGGLTTANGSTAVAFGVVALANGENTSAFGRAAIANADSASAFGTGANASFANSTAIGIGATATATNQVRMGRSSETVSIPGTLSLAGGASLLATASSLTNGAAAQLATMTNGPVAGNPSKWFAINDNGTTRYVPSW